MRNPTTLILGLFYVALGMVLKPLPLAIPTLMGTVLVIGWLAQHPLPGASGLAFVGGASYALYLWHLDLIRTFGMIGLVSAALAAALSWALIERPVLNWAHRVSAAWKLQQADAARNSVPA
jgi:peptidoglycan/LPS O-acetylase OafA/YrhL